MSQTPFSPVDLAALIRLYDQGGCHVGIDLACDVDKSVVLLYVTDPAGKIVSITPVGLIAGDQRKKQMKLL